MGLRLCVDQDALDFLKAFGAFKPEPRPSAVPAPPPTKDEFFFRKLTSSSWSIPHLHKRVERVEVFPIALMLDYKPKRVDYKALREGKTIELMNFFHFDGAEMTLRRIELSGVS